MVKTVDPVKTVPLSNIMKVRFLQDRISLPLSGAGIAFARFRHIVGVPASEKGEGFSFSKLLALDTLIDNLARVKNIRHESLNRGSDSSPELDALIEKYSNELHEALVKPEPYFQKADAGVFFQLSA